jgi:iturin family lipopeptide synthetase B
MPKGIVVLHQNIVSCLLAEKRLYKFSKTLVTCHTTNYSFDVSLLEIFLPLVCGGFVVIPDGDIFSAAYLPALLQRSSVTVLQGTPSFFRGFLELLPQQGQKVLPSLQHLCIGGESLTYDLVERIHQRLPHVQVNNHYGPTEITIDALVNTHISQFDKNILGIPLPNTTVYVLDGTFKPVPKGIVGQICIGGLGVSQGYIHTSISDNFRTDPFASQGLMYCTGDLGRWTEDIKIEFFGRMDDQVKIRGNRVELGEIEACLLKHESVSEAILSVLKDESGQDYLVAYYTGSEGVNDAKLHDFLSQYLPQYMIPAFFIKADKFQYTSSGKIDKKELLPPQRTVSGAAIEYTAPENEVERHLLQVVEAVLAKAPISLKANFFEQGGDSIKAIQVAARLNHLGYTVAIKDIFLYPTFAEIAKAMKRSTHQIDQSAVSGKVPLTPIQQEFFETVRTSPHHYNHAILLRSTDRILIDVVRAVFQELAKHHDTLRTGFKINQDAIVQLVYPVEEFEPTIYEADLREAEDDKGQLEHEVNQLQSSLDFTSGSLWKAGLFHLKEDDRLLIIIHHLLIDGVSWRILLEDLQTLYGQWQRKQPWMLPLKTDSFQHWAKQLQQYATSETLLGEVSYWRGVLSENYQPLPGDEVILDNLKRDEASTSFKLDKAQTKALLTEVNTTYKTEINDILLTALSLSMSETFGMSSIMIALEGHGREELFAATNITRTIGWFTSVYPIIVHIGASKDLAYQIKHTKETLRSIPTKGIGYGVLKYCTPPHLTGDLDFKKKPHLGFNYLGQVDADIENMSLGVAEESSGLTQSLDGERDFALEVQAIVVEGKLQLRIAYNSLQFENKTMDTLANTLQAELVRIIAHCTMQKYKELVTPSDLGFKDISIQQLETFFNS